MDEYVLERMIADNAIKVDFFLPCTILRLQQVAPSNQKATLSVQLINVNTIGESYKELLLSWSTNDVVEERMPLQERVVTEWAAVGLACVLVPLYTRLRVLQVTQAGDRFDYWIGDEEWEYALEVSGMVEGSLAGRHTAKVRQLQMSPYRVDGYVMVARFATLEAMFSFNRYRETVT